MCAMMTHSLSGKLDHLFAGGVTDSHNRLQRVPTLSQNHKALLACNGHRARPVRLEQAQLGQETCQHTSLATPVTAYASHFMYIDHHRAHISCGAKTCMYLWNSELTCNVVEVHCHVAESTSRD